jgi:hypothetical protein
MTEVWIPANLAFYVARVRNYCVQLAVFSRTIYRKPTFKFIHFYRKPTFKFINQSTKKKGRSAGGRVPDGDMTAQPCRGMIDKIVLNLEPVQSCLLCIMICVCFAKM